MNLSLRQVALGWQLLGACLLLVVPALGQAATTEGNTPEVWARLPVLAGVVISAITVIAGLSLWGRIKSLQQALADKEADLARSAAEWTQAMDFLEDPMYLVDLDDRLVRANKAFYKQIGKTQEGQRVPHRHGQNSH